MNPAAAAAATSGVEVGQPWTATTWSLSQLGELGLDPSSDRARRAVAAIGANARWSMTASRSAAAVTGAAPDPRLGEAVAHVRSRRSDDGTWPLDWRLPGRVWFDVDDGAGQPSRWVTLRAMRVLRWWER
jgi:hypothetical protein